MINELPEILEISSCKKIIVPGISRWSHPPSDRVVSLHLLLRSGSKIPPGIPETEERGAIALVVRVIRAGAIHLTKGTERVNGTLCLFNFYQPLFDVPPVTGRSRENDRYDPQLKQVDLYIPLQTLL